MELEELKKSWNALDEHLKDKELIKEEELGKLIGHADKGIHIIIILSWIPALYWDITTTRFLQQTKVDEMPLIEVISRVNRIHRWMIRERLIATAFLLILAVLSFIYWQIWQYGIAIILFFILLWGAGLGLILWIYRKKFLNRIQEIKKNLDELKIIDN